MTGGVGKPWGVVIGCLLITVIANGLDTVSYTHLDVYKRQRSPARTGLNGDIHQIAARNVVFMTRIV